MRRRITSHIKTSRNDNAFIPTTWRCSAMVELIYKENKF